LGEDANKLARAIWPPPSFPARAKSPDTNAENTLRIPMSDFGWVFERLLPDESKCSGVSIPDWIFGCAPCLLNKHDDVLNSPAKFWMFCSYQYESLGDVGSTLMELPTANDLKR
jgi:hypothetical protein